LPVEGFIQVKFNTM